MDLRPHTASGHQPQALVIAGENPQLGRMLPGQIHSDRAQTYTQWWSKSSEFPVRRPSPVLWFLTFPLHWNSDFLLLSVVHWCSFLRTIEPLCLIPHILATKPLFKTTILFSLLHREVPFPYWNSYFSMCTLDWNFSPLRVRLSTQGVHQAMSEWSWGNRLWFFLLFLSWKLSLMTYVIF